MGNWTFPASTPKGLASVGRAILFRPQEDAIMIAGKRNEIQKTWKNGHGIVFSAEVLSYVAALSEEELQSAMGRLRSLFPTNAGMTAVVTYRTSRYSHLVSAWTQEMSAIEVGGTNFVWRKVLSNSKNESAAVPALDDWLCRGVWEGHARSYVDKFIASQLNPMGVASAFQKYMNVSIIDMSGVEDMSSEVACEVLGIPCTAHNKVLGWEDKEILMENHRPRPTLLKLSDATKAEMENILRRMDCYYYCGIRDNVKVLHANDDMFLKPNGWADCCSSPGMFLSPAKAYEQLKRVGCRESEGVMRLMNNTVQQPSYQPHIFTAKRSALPSEMDRTLNSLLSPSFHISMLFLAMLVYMFRHRNIRHSR